MQNVTRNSFSYSCRFLADVRVWFWVIGKCATCFVVCRRWLQETDGISVIQIVTTQPLSVRRWTPLPGQFISNIYFHVSLENRVPNSSRWHQSANINNKPPHLGLQHLRILQPMSVVTWPKKTQKFVKTSVPTPDNSRGESFSPSVVRNPQSRDTLTRQWDICLRSTP